MSNSSPGATKHDNNAGVAGSSVSDARVVVEIREFSFSYAEHDAVRDLSLAVKSGEIVGLLGPNGAGKTTTIKALVGLLRPTPGQILIGGDDITKCPDAVKQRVAYVPDKPHLYELLTAWEYLSFVAGLWGLDSNGPWQARAEAELTRFGLFDVRHHLLGSFSQGMRQKALLIAGIIHRPDVWILDEPMSGLDPRAARLMRDVLREEADRGAAILFSTHTLDIAERMCDRVAIIDQGRLIALGTVDALRHTHATGKSAERLEDLFLRLTETADEKTAAEGLK